MKRLLTVMSLSTLVLTACQAEQAPEEQAPEEQAAQTDKQAAAVDFENVRAPSDLAEQLKDGGYVIVFRYTGSGGPSSEVPADLNGKVKDDGQRISEESIRQMKAYGGHYRSLGIPVSDVLSSEYYFVWQHADAAFGQPITITRDLTGSLDFDDQKELDRSLQQLRERTMTAPAKGQNTILFTHQGKFDKAYGYYPPAGTTIIFKPDGSDKARVVAVLSMEEFMAL